MAHRIPVTVLTGYSGAGKTAVLEHLRANGGARVGVADDVPGLAALAEAGGVDCLLMEAPALDDPLAVAGDFAFEEGLSSPAGKALRLDTVATVVDASTFLAALRDAEFLQDAESDEESDEAGDDRTVADVLVAQVELCDVIVLNKTDLAGPDETARVRRALHALNPRADLLEATFGNVPAERLLDTGLFDFEATGSGVGWMAALRGEPVGSAGIAGSDGVGVIVYRRRRPFHPQRFADLIHTEWLRQHGNVLRSKGLFWLASRMGIAGDWSQAGGVCRPGAAGAWWAALDEGDWPADAADRAEVEADMLDAGQPSAWGDRRQELVLIGERLDGRTLEALLDACLLTDAEMAAGPDAWAAYPDSFPAWEEAFDDEDGHDHHHHHDGDGDCDCGHPHHHGHDGGHAH